MIKIVIILVVLLVSCFYLGYYENRLKQFIKRWWKQLWCNHAYGVCRIEGSWHSDGRTSGRTKYECYFCGKTMEKIYAKKD